MNKEIEYNELPINKKNYFELQLGNKLRKKFKSMGLDPKEWQVRKYIEDEIENTMFIKDGNNYYYARIKQINN